MNEKPDGISAVILAGGRSSRMGSCKAELPWNGSTLIQHQTDKMRRLGIEDIMISGYPVPVEGTRFVPDIYPGKGPLGGIHAGLLGARFSRCLVTGVDTPLVPDELLSALLDFHLKGGAAVTVVSHGDLIEPVIGVYDSRLCTVAEEILRTDNTRIRQLLNAAGCARFPFEGDLMLLYDCNTPDELEKAAKHSASAFPERKQS